MADSAVVVNGVYRKLSKVIAVDGGVYRKGTDMPVVINGVYRKGWVGFVPPPTFSFDMNRGSYKVSDYEDRYRGYLYINGSEVSDTDGNISTQGETVGSWGVSSNYYDNGRLDYTNLSISLNMSSLMLLGYQHISIYFESRHSGGNSPNYYTWKTTAGYQQGGQAFRGTSSGSQSYDLTSGTLTISNRNDISGSSSDWYDGVGGKITITLT